jgi:hypothetical protein
VEVFDAAGRSRQCPEFLSPGAPFAAYEWGGARSAGAGPAQLALSILIYFLPEEKALSVYRQFERDVTTQIEGDTWELSVKEIEEWIHNNGAGVLP